MPSEAPTPLRPAEIHVFKQKPFFLEFLVTVPNPWSDFDFTVLPEKTEFPLNF